MAVDRWKGQKEYIQWLNRRRHLRRRQPYILLPCHWCDLRTDCGCGLQRKCRANEWSGLSTLWHDYKSSWVESANLTSMKPNTPTWSHSFCSLQVRCCCFPVPCLHILKYTVMQNSSHIHFYTCFHQHQIVVFVPGKTHRCYFTFFFLRDGWSELIPPCAEATVSVPCAPHSQNKRVHSAITKLVVLQFCLCSLLTCLLYFRCSDIRRKINQ